MTADPRALTIWTIYRSPRDFPGKWVLRGQDSSARGVRAHDDCFVADTLEEVRKHLPPGLFWMGRNPNDDPVIHEIWL